jgi:hypothetical protein
MRLAVIAAGSLCLLSAELVVQAAEQELSASKAEYKPLMQAVEEAYDAMEDAIDDKDAAAARQHAEELSERMSKIIEFWTSHDVDDAQTFATNVKTAAEEVAAKVAASDFAGAEAAQEQASRNCASCHEVHRKFSLGGWKIK